MTDAQAEAAPAAVVAEVAADEAAPVPVDLEPFSIEVLPMILDYQRQHGLRRSDYNSYRQFCARRIRRIRTSLSFLNGRHRFAAKPVTVDKVSDVKYLHIALMDAERAWAYAMQDKQSPEEPRKGHHAIRRLRKAAAHAKKFASLVTECGRCDARTELEATAYKQWVVGSLAFELQDWQAAFTAFSEAKLIYEKLAGACNEELKPLYAQRAAEIDANLRYCTYEMKGSGVDVADLMKLRETLAGSGATDLLSDKLDSVLAQTREKEAETLTEVTWRDKTIPVRSEKVRVAIIKARVKEADLAQADTGDLDTLMSLYDELFIAYGDALGQVKEDLRSEEKASARIMSQKSEALLAMLRDLQAYLTWLKLERTIDRNLLLINKKRAALDRREPGVKPDDFVRLYDTLILNLEDLGEIAAEKEDFSFAKTSAAKRLHYRACRCFYVAGAQQNAGKTREALLLFQRTVEHAMMAKAHYSECEEDASAAVAELDSLLQQVRSRKCAVHAEYLLRQHEEEPAAADAAQKTLYGSLGTFDCSPRVVKDAKFVAFPPEFGTIACKPLFFDLANNHLRFPSLEERTAQKGGVTDAVGGLVKGVGSMLGGWWGGSKA